MKSQRWVLPKNFTLWVDADSKKFQKIQMVQNAKNLLHSSYHIHYQPKGAISLVQAVTILRNRKILDS